MPVSTELATLEAPRNELHQELATLGSLCLGSLLSRYQKCGKATFLLRRRSCRRTPLSDGGFTPTPPRLWFPLP